MDKTLVAGLSSPLSLAHTAGRNICGAHHPFHLGIVPVSTLSTSVDVTLNCPDTVEKLNASGLFARRGGPLSTFAAKVRVLGHVLRLHWCHFTGIIAAFQVGHSLRLGLLQLGWPGHDV